VEVAAILPRTHLALKFSTLLPVATWTMMECTPLRVLGPVCTSRSEMVLGQGLRLVTRGSGATGVWETENLARVASSVGGGGRPGIRKVVWR
jgi:hypothetical protein